MEYSERLAVGYRFGVLAHVLMLQLYIYLDLDFIISIARLQVVSCQPVCRPGILFWLVHDACEMLIDPTFILRTLFH